MGVNSREPEFDLNSSFVPVNISEFLKDLSLIGDDSEKAIKIDDYVLQLQDELKKVDAFKRELPLCMLLLNDAIERLKREKMKCTEMEGGQLMAFKGGKSDANGGAKKSSDCSDKKNWMDSVQLWSTRYQNSDTKKQDLLSDFKSMKEGDGSRSSGGKLYDQICNRLHSSGGAFVPYKRQAGLILKENNNSLPVDGLSLCIPSVETGIGSIKTNLNGNIRGTTNSSWAEPERKRRRCWSPELHRRFVNALQQLGGPQVATPKQIREVMQVGDLTNDEVKSHLQKYRLHVRKLPASSAPQLSCSWLPRDQYNNMQRPSNSQSGSPEGPLGSAKGVSATAGDSMEEEDVKSEGHTWKGWRPKRLEDRL